MTLGTPVTDDDDLGKRAKRDDFWIRRILKFAILGVAIVFLIAITAVVCQQLFTDSGLRNAMLNNIKDNMVGIILGVAAILGVNLKDIKA